MEADDRRKRSLTRGGRAGRYKLPVSLFFTVGIVAIVVTVGVLVHLQGTSGPRGFGPPTCPPQPTAALPYDPTDERQLTAHATDIFVGQLVGFPTGPDPASLVPGAPPNDLAPVHLAVAVLETEKGEATGTVVVHQALLHGIEGCHLGVGGDYPIEDRGDVLRFVTVRDEPTGTYSLIAGPYSHERVDVLPGTVLPLVCPSPIRLSQTSVERCPV